MYTSDNLIQPQYAVKILDLNTEERAIYERLLPLDPASPNHTLPGCEIAPEGYPLLIMPRVNGIFSIRVQYSRDFTLYELLGFFQQVVEVGRSLMPHNTCVLTRLCRVSSSCITSTSSTWCERPTLCADSFD